MIEKSGDNGNFKDKLKKLSSVFKKRKDVQYETENNTPKDIFEEKIESSDYKNKISSITERYGLGDPKEIYVEDRYIDRSESNDKFFVNIEYRSHAFDKKFFKKNKPKFVIFVHNQSDDGGAWGNVYVPIDDGIRLVSFDALAVYGTICASDKIKGEGYELLNPQDHDSKRVRDEKYHEEHWPTYSVSPLSKARIHVYGQKDADMSLLKAHIGENWQF